MLSFTLTLLPSIKNLLVPQQTPLERVRTLASTCTQCQSQTRAFNYRFEAERPSLNWWRSTPPPSHHPPFLFLFPYCKYVDSHPLAHIKMGANPRGTAHVDTHLLRRLCAILCPLTPLPPSFSQCAHVRKPASVKNVNVCFYTSHSVMNVSGTGGWGRNCDSWISV